MSTVTQLRPKILEVTTSEAHVRAAHKSYSTKNPELAGALVQTEMELRFKLYIPMLGETLTYRAALR